LRFGPGIYDYGYDYACSYGSAYYNDYRCYTPQY
jgi:hypothetical protein